MKLGAKSGPCMPQPSRSLGRVDLNPSLYSDKYNKHTTKPNPYPIIPFITSIRELGLR